jgi:tetratricopeptide (TPR) repeat protein
MLKARTHRTTLSIAWFLYVLIAGGSLLMYFGDPAAWVRFTYEDRLGEWLQMWLFAAVAVLALMVAYREPGYRWFCLVLAAAACYTVMEEISWGQRLIGFESPAFFAERNVQGETNLHNLVTGPLNSPLKGFIEMALAVALFGYGLIYPLLRRLGLTAAEWFNRRGVLPPPLYLWPFFVTAALLELGLLKVNEAEIAELLVGTGLVLTLLHVIFLGESRTKLFYIYAGLFGGLVGVAYLTTAGFLALPGRAEQADARLANGYEKFATRFERQGKYPQAALLYRAGFELGPRYLPMLHEALRNYKKAGNSAAYDYWYRVMLDATAVQVTEAPDTDTEKLLMLADEYAGIGATNEAAIFAEQAFAAAVAVVARDPGAADGYYWLGRVYQARGDSGQARRNYALARAIEPGRAKFILALRSLPQDK